MNPFLACFLACALVQAISIVVGIQYMAWQNRKAEAQSVRAILPPPPTDLDIRTAQHRAMTAGTAINALPTDLDCPLCGRAISAAEPPKVA